MCAQLGDGVRRGMGEELSVIGGEDEGREFCGLIGVEESCETLGEK